MLAQAELNVLASWCRSHAVTWVPETKVGGIAAFRLEPKSRHVGLAPTVIELRDGQFHLVDEQGDELAMSPCLQPVLDALEGGVGEKPKTADNVVSFRLR